MASAPSTPLKRLCHRLFAFLYVECPGGNRHNRLTQKECLCCWGENGQGKYLYVRGEWKPLLHYGFQIPGEEDF